VVCVPGDVASSFPQIPCQGGFAEGVAARNGSRPRSRCMKMDDLVPATHHRAAFTARSTTFFLHRCQVKHEGSLHKRGPTVPRQRQTGGPLPRVCDIATTIQTTHGTGTSWRATHHVPPWPSTPRPTTDSDVVTEAVLRRHLLQSSGHARKYLQEHWGATAGRRSDLRGRVAAE
jgi:hypothetical protein